MRYRIAPVADPVESAPIERKPRTQFSQSALIREAMDHPHNVAPGTYPVVNGVRQPAPAPRFGGTPSQIGRAPVAIGADTRAVLESLGMAAADIAALGESGVI